MDMKINVLLVDFGSVKAFVSVTIDYIEIRGFRVVDQNDGDAWVAMPSREFQAQGEVKNFNLLHIADPDKKKAFCDTILAEYVKKVEEKSS
jgi:DNA-binding cell septation regulator SpoVG